jgi:uncharacterized membrane protein YfcA
MEVTVQMFIVLFGLAFGCEFIDASLGMGYGTILSPVLIIMGFDPISAVSAILLSQALGGFTASVFHHQFENVNFSKGSMDLKIVVVITSFGMLATILAACVGLSVPKEVIKTYIGVLVFVMGLVLLSNRTFAFSWRKMVGVGILSAFNKGLSGGGFGPVVTSGQIISGQGHKRAIGVTTLAEAPICIVGFLTYLVGTVAIGMKTPVLDMRFSKFLVAMFSGSTFQWELALALLLGSMCVAPFGAFATKVMKTARLSIILGIFVAALGLWSLWETWKHLIL